MTLYHPPGAPPAVTDAPPAATDAPPPAVATGVGVTEAPCGDAVNDGNGCIYLGVISDLTVGPFSALAIPAVKGLNAFWDAVNSDGGIGGFDVTVTVPATWWSGWAFAKSDGNGLVIEAGANYCHEAMNDFDFALSTFGPDMTYGLVYFPNDYGFDYSAGIKIAAAANGIGAAAVDHVQIPQSVGGDVAEAVTLILGAELDVVFITTGPNEMAGTLGGVAGAGGTTVFIGTHPTWNPALVGLTDLVPALEALYFQSDWIPGWYGDSEGHRKAKAAADAVDQAPNEWFLNGWASQYPVKALLTQAIGDGDITRAGTAAAASKLTDVSFEGMVPNSNLAGTPESVPRASLINRVDATAPGGTVNVTPLAVGPTAAAHDFTSACFEIGG